jgi:ADP-glucose pyrophosphorylase
MNRFILCVLAAGVIIGNVSHAQAARNFHGEVSDSQCALNVHSLTRSHQEMLKSKSMGGTSGTCSMYCIEHLGGYLVLSSGDQVYRLDRSDLVHGFEGQKVVVNGTLDTKLNEIHVLKIDLDSKN